jgi:aspartyl-tRNA(Asn)/glutamyl-tRNA(Gln) amidotransferase subunit A
VSGEILTVAEAGAALRDNRISSVELTKLMLSRADRLDSALGTYLHRSDESALAAARQADDGFRAGTDRGPLQGIPLAVKDILSTADSPTTAQSLVLDPEWGNRADAPAVHRLRKAGAVLTGKTSTMEFAIGLPDPAKPFPVPRNPWLRSAWSGGSSSGTANGVAAGMFFGGLGTDTGGSIRMPSALCGVTGLKPTWGRVPKSACVPLASTLDHVGPIARSAHDCALILNAIAGVDPTDDCSADVPVSDYTATLTGSVEGLRVGVEREHHTRAPLVDPSAAARFEEAIETLARAGAEIVEVSMGLWDALNDATIITTFSEAFTYHRANLQKRWDDYGVFTRTMVSTGAFYTSTDYVQAQRVRRAGRREVLELLRSVDVIAGLTVGAGAPPVEGLDFSSVLMLPVFTAVWDGLGFPAISVPCGFTDAGLPVGLQLSAGPWDEARVLSVADAYQRITDWHLRVPECAAD